MSKMMSMDERIKRINELYHKSQLTGLTEKEKEEQNRLRKEYVASIRGNLRNQLENMSIQYEDGHIEKVTLNLSVRKKNLRKSLLAARDELSEEEKRRAETLITERILGHQWFYNSSFLLCFASFGSEISTWEIIEEALKKGKEVYLPKVQGEKIVFYRYFGEDDLISGYQGIREPSGQTEEFRFEEEKMNRTLLLMPGVGFDQYGNRLGYGKGFYDRFLADKEELRLRSIAIGHKCQMTTEELPKDENDRKPYQVILV